MEYRQRGSRRGLWADAICINQTWEAEKSSQVQMMGDIYSAAFRTIIWLGQMQPSDIDGIAIAELSYSKRSREDDIIDGSAFTLDPFNCGSPEFHANNIALCRSKYRIFGSLPIWISMAHNIAMEETEIIDRYFALAGICTGQPSDFVNYSKTPEEIAPQVGLMTLLGIPDCPMPDGLDHLADRPSLRLQSQQVRIPSWVPDFLSNPFMGLPISRTYNTENLRDQQPLFPYPEFHVVTDDLEKEPSFPFADLKIQELQIKGTILDRIKAVIPPIDKDWIPNGRSLMTKANPLQDLNAYIERYYRYSAKMIQFISQVRLLADPQLTYQDEIVSGDSFEDFWRTLCYNRTGRPLRQEERPDEGVGVSFRYWFLISKLFLTRRWEQDLILFVMQNRFLSPLILPFAASFDRMYGSMPFFVSENGRIGWVSHTACSGDSIGVFRGNRIPFVAKLVGDHIWEYGGGCYVHGCMDGEVSGKDDVDWRFLRFV